MFNAIDNTVHHTEQCVTTLVVEECDYITCVMVQTRSGRTVRLSINDQGQSVGIAAHLEPGEAVSFHAITNDGDCFVQPLVTSETKSYNNGSWTTTPEMRVEGDSVVARYSERTASAAL